MRRNIRESKMCIYSLHGQIRQAKVGEPIVTRQFEHAVGFSTTPTQGLVEPVCVLHGAQLGFKQNITLGSSRFFGLIKPVQTNYAVAKLIEIGTGRVHKDALEFPDGRTVLLNLLTPGQHAEVLQLPADPLSQKNREHRRLAKLADIASDMGSP